MGCYDIRFKSIDDLQHFIYAHHFTGIFIFFCFAYDCKDFFKAIRVSRKRSIESYTYLNNPVGINIKTCGFQVKCHFEKIIIIIKPFKKTFTCRYHKLFLWAYNKVLPFLISGYSVIIFFTVDGIFGIFKKLQECRVGHWGCRIEHKHISIVKFMPNLPVN